LAITCAVLAGTRLEIECDDGVGSGGRLGVTVAGGDVDRAPLRSTVGDDQTPAPAGLQDAFRRPLHRIGSC
jgi:hypothetical protein